MTSKDELFGLLKQARELCVLSNVPRYQLLKDGEAASEDQWGFLQGDCVANAEKVAQILSNNISSPVYIVEGGLDIPDEPTPSSYADAKDIGTVHNWVYVETDDGGYHVEVASESDKLRGVEYGDMFIRTETPADYIEFRRVKLHRA